MAAAHNNIFIKIIGALRIDVVKKCVDKPGTESVMMGSDLSYYSIKVDAGRWNVRKYLRIINRWTFWEPHGVTDLVLEKRGILARVHEASYRFLFFRLLSAKMGTKIVRVAIFSIYNP